MANYRLITFLLAFMLIQCQTVLSASSTAFTTKCCTPATIVSVSGTGIVTGVPDIASFTITLTSLASTSAAATSIVAGLNAQTLSILAGFGVAKSDIQTAGLFISPSYNYTNGTAVLAGQQATQTISVTVRNISAATGAPVGNITDALVNLNGITISGVNFDISNKTPLKTQARALAFADAKSKAQQYATLSSMTLGQPQKISDSISLNAPPIFFAAQTQTAATTISVGTYNVEVDITIDWILF